MKRFTIIRGGLLALPPAPTLLRRAIDWLWWVPLGVVLIFWGMGFGGWILIAALGIWLAFAAYDVCVLLTRKFW